MKTTNYLITTVIFLMLATGGYAQKWNQTKSLIEKWDQTKSLVDKQNQTKSLVVTTESKQMQVSSENSERLDSVVTYLPNGQVTSRTEYVYNSAGKVIQVTLQDYNCESSGCDLSSASKYKYGYDAAGNTTSIESYEYDTNTQEWNAKTKYTNTYDSKKRPLVTINYIWENSKWTNKTKTEYAYDDANRSFKTFDFSWDTLSSTWLPTERAVMKYDANYNPISLVEEKFENSTWIPEGRELYSYNSSNNLTSEEYYKWSETESKWIEEGKIEYKYNAQGYNIKYEMYQWDDITNEWVAFMKTERTFDNKGNVKEELTSLLLDPADQTWIELSKDVYERDKDGKVTTHTYYSLDFETGALTPKYKTESTYNKYGNLHIDKVYDYSAGSWVHKSTTIYYYQPGSYSDVLSLSDANIMFYPNPASEYFVIRGLEKEATVSIFDISGKKVKEETAVSDKKISISTLPKGIYLVKVNDNIGKLVVK